MSDDREARLEAGRLVAGTLADPAVRAKLRRDGFTSSHKIVVALDGDLVSVVMNRVRQSPPPGVVAIYEPGGRELHLMGIAPGMADDEADCSGVGSGATIGMLFEAVYRSEHGGLFFRMSHSDRAKDNLPQAELRHLRGLSSVGSGRLASA